MRMGNLNLKRYLIKVTEDQIEKVLVEIEEIKLRKTELYVEKNLLTKELKMLKEMVDK